MSIQPDCFTPFQKSIQGIALPERFTFPFYYIAHPLCVLAAQEVQAYLNQKAGYGHHFGKVNESDPTANGKMFGVLVVQKSDGAIGYLTAFSGKLAGSNHHQGFVPPVFDILVEQGFYRTEEDELNAINARIAALEQDPELAQLEQYQVQMTSEAEKAIAEQNRLNVAAKAKRQTQREISENQDDAATSQSLEAALIEESKRDHFLLRDTKKLWKERIVEAKLKFEQKKQEVIDLKELRKNKSAEVQQKIFDHYSFLNKSGSRKSLADIFQRNAATPPPAGAGECAAPKLLQYAFLYDLKPLAMAEFWWGQSPSGEMRKHGQYYPACRNKCEPILSHMLEGIEMDRNPLAEGSSKALSLEIIYEDAHLIVVNKPAGLLSVPGKTETDSVYFRIKRDYPSARGPMIVHRLDMSTSGLMVLAKSAEVHKDLQGQFLKRTVKKRYEALLEGVLTTTSGVIDLPLSVDLDDRPRQMVCYTYGKSARTEWELVATSAGKSRVHFYPITGRTHQLRVHAAHQLGLNTPMVGDELYGNHGDRLCLHAGYLSFVHPHTKEEMVFELGAEF